MTAVARQSDPTIPTSDDASLARGEAVRRQLEAQEIPLAAIDEELDADTTAAALAWMRGEGPCPSIA